MKKLFVATIAATVLCGAPAFAADLGAPIYTKAPPIAPYNWAGFYVGGNVGYGWGKGDTDAVFVLLKGTFNVLNGSLRDDPKGVLGGAQVGYNWQVNTVVFGVEADFQGSDIRGSSTGSLLSTAGTVVPGAFRSSDQKLPWFGTLRGRLGAAVTPNLLLYGTVGLAYGHFEASADTVFAGGDERIAASISKTKAGWTAGAGAEWMFARSWSAKVEYLYLDLGKVSASGVDNLVPNIGVLYTWKTQDNIVRAGVNYHF